MAESAGPQQAGVLARLRSFDVTRSPLDRVLVEYGPLLVLAQALVTLFVLVLHVLYVSASPNPQQITWAVYSPIYLGVLLTLFVESVALRAFAHRIPLTFQQLWDEGALAKPDSSAQAGAFAAFLDDFERRLNSRYRLLPGIALAVTGLAFFWLSRHLPFTLEKWFDGAPLGVSLLTTLVNTLALFLPAVVVGYALGVGAWRSVVTGLYVRRFSKTFDLAVQPSHPDNAGGLKALGDLIFALAALLIIASLALSGLTILSDVVSFEVTKVFARTFLGLTIALSLIAFFLPLLSTHERMLAEKAALQSSLVEIARRIADLERSAYARVDQMDYKERRDIFEEVASLTELYRRTNRIPTWPFDREILFRFAAPQLLSFLSFVGLVDPLFDLARSLLNR